MRLAWMVVLTVVCSSGVSYAGTPDQQCSALNTDTRSCVARGSNNGALLNTIEGGAITSRNGTIVSSFCLDGESETGGGVVSGGAIGGISGSYRCCCRNKSSRVTDLQSGDSLV